MSAPKHLHLAALLHDIGKFRMRGTDRSKSHQEHSYEFVADDFADFFSVCGDVFKNAIRHHHPERYPGCSPTQLQHLIEKQVILADRLSATEREDEEKEGEDFVESLLISILSRLEGATQEYHYPLTSLNLERDTIIPSEFADVSQETYTSLWEDFIAAFHKATKDTHYTSAFYQTIVALLHKYTSRMPSTMPSGQNEAKIVPDISLYDHLRTTAAIATCIGRELSENEVDTQLIAQKDDETNICALIKGDISGIQNFLYQILSSGAARELRGRSFYLQLLTEAIAHWVLRQFNLPVTSLLLASGGHFYILAPYSETMDKLDTLRRTISQNLWTLHGGDLSCILASVPISTDAFGADNFSSKWRDVSEKVHQRKQEKWSEMNPEDMFENFFEPHRDKEINWGFGELGRHLREATCLVSFEIPESPISENPDWRAAIKAFGLDVHLCTDIGEKPTPQHAERAVVYRLGDTDFLTDEMLKKFQWEGIPVSYDFRSLPQVIAHRRDSEDQDIIADYDYLANASEGVQWFGALRMDVDDLGTVFSEKLDNATISRLATLSESIRFFFEGYVPYLCREYNAEQENEILELIYAGGDDLFLVGGWSALPEIADQIRSEFRHFVTGDHVTLSGGIAIEHKKYPLHQFADQSGEAEKTAKSSDGKNAITFLRKPMTWSDFGIAHRWHNKFLEAMRAERNSLPSVFLTRLNQIYADEKRWAWRSLYYFHRLLERYKTQTPFLRELQHELNFETSHQLREFIHVITRWTALQIRNKED